LVKLGLLEQAIARFREAIGADPELTSAHRNLDAVLRALGRRRGKGTTEQGGS
jgi:hypothetical protein